MTPFVSLAEAAPSAPNSCGGFADLLEDGSSAQSDRIALPSLRNSPQNLSENQASMCLMREHGQTA